MWRSLVTAKRALSVGSGSRGNLAGLDLELHRRGGISLQEETVFRSFLAKESREMGYSFGGFGGY